MLSNITLTSGLNSGEYYTVEIFLLTIYRFSKFNILFDFCKANMNG